MKRTTIVMISLLFTLGGFASIVPTATAQSGDLVVDDAAGDVVPYLGTSNGAVPGTPVDPAQVPSNDVTNPADLKGFAILGETATHLSFELSVESFSRYNTYQPAELVYTICFTWSGTGANYRMVFGFGFKTPNSPEVNKFPDPQGALLERVTDCAPESYVLRDSVRIGEALFVWDVDLESGVISATISRALFAAMVAPDAEDGAVAPRPMAGDTFTNVQAFAVAKGGPAYYFYDTTTVNEYTFKIDTGNDKVKVKIPSKVRAGYIGGFDTPLYGVEIGSYQVVPVTIENHLPNPIKPNINATILIGDETKWRIRTLPSIDVPAMSGDTPGTATVTLIVNSESTVVHKDQIRVLVSALDPAYPELGAQAVDIVGVSPPGSGNTELFFHSKANPCRQFSHWINTLKTDNMGPATEMPFHSCDPQSSAVGKTITTEASYVFRPDVPFARDYTISTTQDATATLYLRSVLRPVEERDAPVSMVASVTVQILEGNNVIGEGTMDGQQITGDRAAVNVPVTVLGEILGGSGRKVTDDKGLGVRITVAADSRTYEIGGFCPADGTCIPEDEQQVDTPGGKIYMDLVDSKLVLPVVQSQRSGVIYNITESGALMSLALSEGQEAKRFANPAQQVVYNLTVRNEGVNLDTADISAVIDQEGWKVEILPVKSYKLAVGQGRAFNVRVSTPDTATEGDILNVEITATSKVDPAAKATVPLEIEITTGEKIDQEGVDENLQQVDTNEDAPAPPAVAFLAVLALLGVALRRRR